MNSAQNQLARWAVTALTVIALACAPLGVARAADEPLTWPAAQIRLKTANGIAQQRGDAAAAAKTRDAALRAKSLIAAGNVAAAEQLVRDGEAAAGLDPGGASMSGLPIHHPTHEMAEHLARLRNDLDAAMRAKDRGAIAKVVAQMRQVLGDQAGLPELAGPGLRTEPKPVDPKDVANHFLAALDENKAQFGQVAAGRPVGDNFVRYYAELVAACCEVRAAVKKHRPDQLDHLDQLVIGGCFLMLALQQQPGHMPFPESKAKADGKAPPQGRWVVSVAEDGGSQFDTGEAGAALLIAGVTHAKPEWTAAGLRAADWAMTQPSVRNFNYNAVSIHLLAEAFRATKNRKYLDAAVEKWEVGLAPGQLENGRWIDARNARTVYHVILLRAVTALADVCPDDYAEKREALRRSASAGIKSLIDEFEQLGVTNTGYALPVLLKQRKLDPGCDPRLEATIRRTAAAVMASCVRDGRPYLGASPAALASVSRVDGE